VSRVVRSARVLEATGLRGALRRLTRWDGALVLAYHRVGDATASSLSRSLFDATAEGFDAQLAILEREADVVPAEALLERRGRSRGRQVVLTFDDGYREMHDVVLPLLRARGLTATFFVATGFVDRPHLAWWDELAWMARESPARAVDLRPWLPVTLSLEDREDAGRRLAATYASLPATVAPAFLDAAGTVLGTGRGPSQLADELWLTWPKVRALRDGGMTIGGHTATHPILARCEPGRQREEVATCARRLREELGQAMTCFAYPVGGRDCFDAASRDAVARAGGKLAFSAYGGASSFDRWDPLDVRRASPPSAGDPALLRAAIAAPTLFARW
jgi:peptidoglycan/xylan/chitin deacetylase (PgdA/CDA1 family)